MIFRSPSDAVASFVTQKCITDPCKDLSAEFTIPSLAFGVIGMKVAAACDSVDLDAHSRDRAGPHPGGR